MSYQRELTTFKKGNQLSTCGEYNLQDLSDMFSETCIGGSEDENGHEVVLEDILTVCSNGEVEKYNLSMSVTIMEQLDDDEMNMFIIKSHELIKSEDEHCDCGNELEGKDVICESCEDEITDEYIITKVDYNDDGGMPFEEAHINHDIIIPCSAELDNQMYNESI